MIHLQADFERILKIAHFLPDGVGVTPIDDSFSPVLPKNCKIEQLAAYQINNELYIDSEIWAAFDQTNRAALYVHESLYKQMRRLGAKDSIRSRKVNGYLFANYPLQPAFDESWQKPGDHLCVSGGVFWEAPSILYFRANPDQTTTIYLVGEMGQPVFSAKTWTTHTNILEPANRGWSMLKWPDSNFEAGDATVLQTDSTETVSLSITSAFGNESLSANYKFDQCLTP